MTRLQQGSRSRLRALHYGKSRHSFGNVLLLGRQLLGVATQQPVVQVAEQDLESDGGADAGFAAVRGLRPIGPEQFNSDLDKEPVTPPRTSVRDPDTVQVGLVAVGLAADVRLVTHGAPVIDCLVERGADAPAHSLRFLGHADRIAEPQQERRAQHLVDVEGLGHAKPLVVLDEGRGPQREQHARGAVDVVPVSRIGIRIERRLELDCRRQGRSGCPESGGRDSRRPRTIRRDRRRRTRRRPGRRRRSRPRRTRPGSPCRSLR